MTMINQAPITGESMPVAKGVGEVVFAGTINGECALECRVTQEAKDSKLSKTLNLIEEAQLKRGKNERWVDQFARIYTPIMIGLACFIAFFSPLFLGGIWQEWISRAPYYFGHLLPVRTCHFNAYQHCLRAHCGGKAWGAH